MLREIFDSNQSKITKLVERISQAFKDKDFPQAKMFIAEIKYFVNIEEKIKERTYFH